MTKRDHSKQLEEFTDKLKQIPEIIAVYYTGSTASQTWDEYSDVDIDIVVKDKDFDKIFKNLPSILSKWGEIKFVGRYLDEHETYAHIGEEYLKVEIDPIKLSNLKPSEELKNIRIGFDKKEILKDIIKKSKKIKPKISHKDFENTLYYLRDWHLYTAKHYSRGLKFSALGEVFDIRVLLLELYAKTKGLKDFEIKRKGEHFLSKKEMGFFRGEKISIGIKNIRKAMKDNWDFMKYIEKEYEKKTKKKLNLKCNDKEILKIINQLYDKK